MKAVIKTLVVPAILLLPLAAACTESYSSSTRHNLDGSQTTKETEVRRNPITGDTTVEHNEVRH